jgi:hypothetical protein
MRLFQDSTYCTDCTAVRFTACAALLGTCLSPRGVNIFKKEKRKRGKERKKRRKRGRKGEQKRKEKDSRIHSHRRKSICHNKVQRSSTRAHAERREEEGKRRKETREEEEKKKGRKKKRKNC